MTLTKRKSPEEHYAAMKDLTPQQRALKIKTAKEKQALQAATVQQWVKSCEYLKE